MLLLKVTRKKVRMFTKKKTDDTIFTSRRLDTIFNQCRKVPPSVKRILIGKGTHSSDYTCIYSKKRKHSKYDSIV